MGDPKKNCTSKIAHTFLKANFMNKSELSAWRAQLSFEMLLSLASEKTVWKYDTFLSWTVPSFSSPCFGKYEKASSKFVLEHKNWMRRTSQSFCNHYISSDPSFTTFPLHFSVMKQTDGDGIGRILEASGAQPLVNNSFQLLRYECFNSAIFIIQGKVTVTNYLFHYLQISLLCY